MSNNRLLPIFLVVFVDLLGFGLILPLLPYYAGSFGASPTMIGLLVTSYAAAQLVGAPVLGRLSDRYGRRPVLMLSILGTFAGFLLLGFAQSLWMLFAARLLSGLTGGNISVAQAYIADVTDEKDRTRGLGILGAAFGLGFIFGPAVGGALSVGGFAVPAFAAAGLSALNLVAVGLWLPESLTAERRAELGRQGPSGSAMGALRVALRRPQVGPLLYIRFFFGLAFATFQSIFPLYAEYRLGLTAQATGYVLAYTGVLLVIVQGFGIGWLTRRSSDNNLILSAIGLMSVSLFAWALVGDVAGLLVVLVPLALAGGVLTTVANSALSKAVRPVEVGGMLGLGAAVEGATRVVGPVAGGFLLQALGPGAPGIFGAAVLLALFPYAWQQLMGHSEPPITGPGEPRLRPIPVRVRD